LAWGIDDADVALAEPEQSPADTCLDHRITIRARHGSDDRGTGGDHSGDDGDRGDRSAHVRAGPRPALGRHAGNVWMVDHCLLQSGENAHLLQASQRRFAVSFATTWTSQVLGASATMTASSACESNS
jgi:hypothetical protein